MQTTITSVSCERGAPMGRRTIAQEFGEEIKVKLVPLFDGDYDSGGAYWGKDEPLYEAFNDEGTFVDYVRAASRSAAQAALVKTYGELKFAEMQEIDPFDLGAFEQAYIKAALFSSNDQSDPETGGSPMDENYGPEHLTQETLAAFVSDCKKFQDSREYKHAIKAEACKYTGCPPEEYAGHDFWLTRNGHGAGFWDGDWEEPHDSRLTDLSKTFGEIDLYVGDDGFIHCM